MFFSCLSKCHPAGPTLQYLSKCNAATLAETLWGRKVWGAKCRAKWSADWPLIRIPQDLKKRPPWSQKLITLWWRWGPMHHKKVTIVAFREGTWFQGAQLKFAPLIGSDWSTQIEKALLDKRLVVSAKNSACQVNYIPSFYGCYPGWSSKNRHKTINEKSSISPSVSLVKVSTFWSPKKLMKPPTASPSNQSSSCFFRRATQRLPRSISLRARAWNRGISTSKEPVWSRNHEVQPSPTFQFHCKILEPPLVTPLVTRLFTMRY